MTSGTERRDDSRWRDPRQVIALSEEAVDPPWETLSHQTSGSWWDLLEQFDVRLLVSREYEHLLLCLGVEDGAPFVTYLPLPHPSGIAVDRESNRVHVASTRNPNAIYDLAPVSGSMRRADRDLYPGHVRSPLVPVRARYFPGSLYLHDLAFVGHELVGNAVGHNCVVRFPDGGYEAIWWPAAIGGDGGPDTEANFLQLNSVASAPDLSKSYFTASTSTIGDCRPGDRHFQVDRRGVVFSGATRQVHTPGLTRPHSARLHGDDLWVDNSGYGELVLCGGGAFEPVAGFDSWTRGLSILEGIAFVGLSRVIPRFAHYAPGLEREKSKCGIAAVDLASGEVLGRITWPGGNQVFAVEWIPAAMSSGFPFGSDKESNAAASDLFYAYDL